jgi:hypothetical protein
VQIRRTKRKELEQPMSTHRETYFTCTYASEETRRTAVVSAWDARMAESVFRTLLEEEPEPVAGGGVIEVEALGGRVAHRTPYAPPAPPAPPA